MYAQHIKKHPVCGQARLFSHMHSNILEIWSFLKLSALYTGHEEFYFHSYHGERLAA